MHCRFTICDCSDFVSVHYKANQDCYWDGIIDHQKYIIGEKDLNLAQRLIAAGSPHDKFLRQIFVSMDINAPRYWWSEMTRTKTIFATIITIR